MAGFIERIKDIFSREEDPELIRLEGGKSECSTCHAPIKGRSIYKVPTIDKHYCKEHAEEEKEKMREQTFNIVPEHMHEEIKFNRDKGYHFECSKCSKKLNVLKLEWAACKHCHKATCKEEMQMHKCPEMEADAREKKEAEMPRRCDFCGTRIIADTSIKCPSCSKFFCPTHAKPEHHSCGRR